jgi:hypothetical protein
MADGYTPDSLRRDSIDSGNQNVDLGIAYRAGKEYNNIYYRIPFLLWLCKFLKRHFVSRFEAIC